jgi:hypothetical protein
LGLVAKAWVLGRCGGPSSCLGLITSAITVTGPVPDETECQ